MTISKKKKKKEGRLVRKITKSQLADPTYKKIQPRKKGKTLTPTELKEFKKLARAHDEEAGYGLASISAELPSKPVMKKKVDPQELKTRLEKQRKKAEAVKDLTPKVEMVKAVYIKDGKRVEEIVVKGDPKLKKLAAVRRVQIKPMSREEMAKIKLISIRQRKDLMASAALYQNQLKAQKFLATAYRGRIKPFPKKGFPIFRIQLAYRKRKPPWNLKIRHNRREEMVYLKMVGPSEKLAGREAVQRETVKILSLMNMRMHPSATIEDVRAPYVTKKYSVISVKVRANKVGEGEIRPRI